MDNPDSSVPWTRIAIVPFPADASISDPNSAAAKAVDEFLKVVVDADGCRRIGWGVKVENPNVAVLCSDWDSLEAHNTFQTTPAFANVFPRVGELQAPSGQSITNFSTRLFYSTHLDEPTTVANKVASPITEIAITYFPPSLTTREAMTWSAAMNKGGKAYHAVSGVKSVAGGWNTQGEGHVQKAEGLKEGRTEAQVFCAMLGWDSEEHYARAQQTEEFKAMFGLVDQGDLFEVFHVAFKEI